MADKRMAKWKLGLLLLGLATAGLFVYVVIQGVQSKQDRATLKSAQSIAPKLNSYVNDNQSIPASLSAAGISDVSGSISYTKKSDSSYQFCITYKAANSDVGSQVEQAVTQAAIERETGSSGFGFDTTGSATELTVDASHKAGRQCQTVKPQLYSDELFGTDGSGSDDSGDNSSGYYDYDSGDSGSDSQNSSTDSGADIDTSNLFNQ